MKITSNRLLVILIMAVLIVTIPVLSGCSQSSSSTTSSPANTATSSTSINTTQPSSVSSSTTTTTTAKPVTLKIGIEGGQTGPAAASVVAMFQEMEYMLKYMNDVEGGVDGIKLDWKIVDDKGTPEGSIASYKELRDSYNPDIFFVVEDYYLLGIKDTIAQDKSVIITPSALDPRSFVPPGQFFGISVPTSDGFAGYVKWVLQNWKGPGQPKIGVLYWDLGSGLAWKQAEPWVLKQGVELVPVQYGITSMDLKPVLMQLRDAGVNYIWMQCLSQTGALVVRDMAALGLTGKIPLTFNEYMESTVLLNLVGKGAAGYTIIRTESPYSDNSEAAQLYTKIWDWAGTKDKWSDNRLIINLKAVINAAVNQAAQDVGKDKVDKVSIYNALNQLTSIDTWGNSHDFGYGPDRRVGVHSMKIIEFTENGTVSASDWISLPRTFEGIDK